jgi:hypothetical protein
MLTLTCDKCGKPTTMLYHVAGIPGDYCSTCKPPEPPPAPDPLTESVNGIVIGPMTARYEFWTTDNKNFIARRDADETPEDAAAWFKETYPAEWATGVRMRIYDN